jgi:hypothetical protein
VAFDDMSSRNRREGHQRTIAVVAVLLAVFGLLGLFSALELISDLHRLARHGEPIAPGLYAIVYTQIVLSAAQAISGLLLSYATHRRSASPGERARRLIGNLTVVATGMLGMLVVGGHPSPAPPVAAHSPGAHRAPQALGEL